ncbi:unnamed protein product, partial [Musa acuminata subsp. burmannicoides]
MAGEIKVGPWGGNGGSEWDMGAADRIIKIDIFASEVIAGILITFTRNGEKETKLFGSILGDPHPISLQEDEYLVGVEGSVDAMW